jgi:hypothetical protein
MNIPTCRELVITSFVLAIAPLCFWATPASAQVPQAAFADVVNAARAHPGCLGVETGQTASGKRVIFAWFEDKKSLVAWYHTEIHMKAVKTAYPNQTFDREPLPDLPEGSGPILAIVSLKLLDAPKPGATSMPISSIGIELYTPLPGGVAVGGRFAPEAITSKVRGLREIDIGTTQGQTR